MRVLEARVLTAALVVAASAWTIARGVQAVAYEVVAERPIARNDIAKTFGPWVNAPGVAALARENLMRVPPDFAEAEQIRDRREALADYLAVVPLSSQRWLELAVMRNASGWPAEKVIEALAMSSLTGPNEAAVILKRAAFALSIWEKLDVDTRARAANDLAVVLPPLDPGGIRLALAIKTDQVRDDVRDTLVAHGVSAQVIQYVGL
jgi:hypothetical protein